MPPSFENWSVQQQASTGSQVALIIGIVIFMIAFIWFSYWVFRVVIKRNTGGEI